MAEFITTFAQRGEFEKARKALDDLRLPYEVVSPDPGYARVGAPAVVVAPEARAALAQRREAFVCAGWVDYRPAAIAVPDALPSAFAEDIFGTAAVMVLAPCVADETKIRVIAHITGDLTEVFPYMNAQMETASYNPHGPTFSFLEAYRMVILYPRRIAIAKADEIVDAWRILEAVRVRANETWARRGEIEPSYEMRRKPPVLEIYKRLPMTNCRQCGEATCLAFAIRVQAGDADVRDCVPVFSGDQAHRREALLEICRGLGVNA